MPSICFLSSRGGEPRNDNHVRIPAAWQAAGWQVVRADHNDVHLHRGAVCLARDEQRLDAFDLIWLVGLGERASFLDRMQLLLGIDATRFVNAPIALLTQHAKYALATGALASHHPETFASSNPHWLNRVIARGGDWIVKPPAASFGRGVYRLTSADPNVAVILDALTGHDGSQFCLLQRYIPEIESGETRVLLAAGEIVGAYKRHPGPDHRANLAANGRAEATILSADEHALARKAAAALKQQCVNFVAVDLAYPWIVEYNLANPGGLATIESLTGVDLAPALVDRLIRDFEARRL